MKKFFISIGVIFFYLIILIFFSIIAIAFSIVPLTVQYNLQAGEYEYVDFNNNRGKAPFCRYNSGGYFCETEDGYSVAVVKYKKIK